MTHAEIANLIPDPVARSAWIAAGMPTDLMVVAQLCVDARRDATEAARSSLTLNPRQTGPGRRSLRLASVA